MGSHAGIVDQDVAAAGAVAPFVVDQRSEQMDQAIRPIAGTHEHAAHRRQSAHRAAAQAIDEILVTDQQLALNEAIEHAPDVAAPAAQCGNRRLDARDLLVEPAELATGVERLQHLRRHDVRCVVGLDDEQAFFARP